MSQPKISILLATFNASRHLAGCLENIRRQTYANKEVIVADGGSSDGTVQILRDHADLISHWSSEPDRGIYDAWNKALDHASGEWVLFRGADDLFWSDDTLARAGTELAQTAADELIAYGRVARYDADGNLVSVMGRPWEHCRGEFFRRMNLPHPATFHRADAFRRFGKFDTRFRVAGDYEFLLRVLRDSRARFIAGEPISAMRHGGLSGSADVRVPLETIRALRKNGARGLPLAQWRQIGICLFSTARHRTLGALAGPQRASEIVNRRRRRRAMDLAEREDVPARLDEVPALALVEQRLTAGVPA